MIKRSFWKRCRCPRGSFQTELIKFLLRISYSIKSKLNLSRTKCVQKLSRSKIEGRGKNPYFYIFVTSEKAQLEKEITLEKLNELFCVWKCWCEWKWGFALNVKTSMDRIEIFQKRETIKRNQLVGECRNKIESTFAVWTSMSCGLCRP